MREHVYLAFNAGAKVTLHDVTLPQQATPPPHHGCVQLYHQHNGRWGLGGGDVLNNPNYSAYNDHICLYLASVGLCWIIRYFGVNKTPLLFYDEHCTTVLDFKKLTTNNVTLLSNYPKNCFHLTFLIKLFFMTPPTPPPLQSGEK